MRELTEIRTEKKAGELALKRAKGVWANADFALSLYNKGASLEDIVMITGWEMKIVFKRIKMAQSFPQDTRLIDIPIDVYEQACEYPDPQKVIEMAWQNNLVKNDLKRNRERSYVPVNPVQPPRKTPLEVALDIDDEGMTTARKLYLFLKLHPAVYSRWLKSNVEENIFAELGEDYFSLNMDVECRNSGTRGQFARDYKLTANFAKKLAMASQTQKGEQVRDYFIAIEQKVKALANGEINSQLGNWILDAVDQFGQNMTRVTVERVIKYVKGA